MNSLFPQPVAANPLRPYQEKAIELLRESLRSGHRRPVLQLPTGSGKTMISFGIIRKALSKENKCLFVVPRISLIEQTVLAFEREGISAIGVIQGQNFRTDSSAQVQIASAQTLVRRDIPAADLVIIDECFGGETPVLTYDGVKRIDCVNVGDEILTAIGWGRVENTFSRMSYTIKLELSNGQSVMVTPYHQFFTDKGWVAASALERGSNLFSPETMLALWDDFQAEGFEGRSASNELRNRKRLDESALLLNILLKEAFQPDEQPCVINENEGHASKNKACADCSGRQRASVATTAISAFARLGGGLVGGTGNKNECGPSQRELSELLQGGHRERGVEDRDRAGRWLSYRDEAPAGFEKGSFPEFIRVENIPHIERQSAEPVFNLHVSGHPSYFAGGVLVHNCHMQFKKITEWIASPAAASVPFIGLTATPWARGMGKTYDDLVKPTSIAEMIAEGFLSPFRVFAPPPPDLSNVRTASTGDYREDELSEACDTKEIVADVVRTWFDKGEGRATLCYGVDRAHAQHLQERFIEAGVATEYIDCDTPMFEREEIFDRFRDSTTKLICNVATLDTGIDLDVRCIIDARPTRSRIRFCLDAEAEILTSHGWQGIGEISEGCCAATMVNLETGLGEWSRVTSVIERSMSATETWIEYDAPRANFRVTDQHRMICADRVKSTKFHHQFDFRIAKKMLISKGGLFFPTAVHMHQQGIPLTDWELYFVGMMMTDGSWTSHTGAISQSERHPHILERIEKCLAACEIAYTKTRRTPSKTDNIHERSPRWIYTLSIHGRQTRDGYGKFKARGERVPGKRGFGYLLPFLDKDLAPALMQISRRQLEILITGLHDGDGFKFETADWSPKSWTICSARRITLDRLQALCAINGMTASIASEGKRAFWRVTITPKDWRHCGGYEGETCASRPQIVERSATKENVWCVETETGTIITRRRGKVTVMGNCQTIGRGLRPGEGKDHLVVLDHAGNHQRLGCVTDIDFPDLDDGEQRINRDKGKPDREPSIKLCTECRCVLPPRARECPACGLKIFATTSIFERAGELVELGSRTNARKGDSSQPLKNFWHGALVQIARRKGYSLNWASHQYRAKFGAWPSSRHPVERDATLEIKNFVRSRQIAFAKSKDRT